MGHENVLERLMGITTGLGSIFQHSDHVCHYFLWKKIHKL